MPFKSASSATTAGKFSLLVDNVSNLLCPSACLSATWRFQELGVATFCHLLCSSQQHTVPHRCHLWHAPLRVRSATIANNLQSLRFWAKLTALVHSPCEFVGLYVILDHFHPCFIHSCPCIIERTCVQHTYFNPWFPNRARDFLGKV